MLNIRGLLAVMFCLGVFGAADAQDKKDAKPAIDKDKIVGSWVFVKGDALLGHIEFTKDGKLIGTADKDLPKITFTYKIDGDRMSLTAPALGTERTEIFTINMLSAEKLVFKSGKGTDNEFRRDSDKKPAPK